MRTLLRVELTRLRWRRAVLLLLLAAVVVPTLIAVAVIFDSRPVSADEMAEARVSGAQEIAQCERHPRRFGVREAEACEEQIVGWYILREPLRLGQQQGESGMAVVAVLTLVVMLVGTTFAGHDWGSGSMSNQLLFEPRRGRVWTAKALAVTLVAFVTSAVVSAGYWLALWAVARSRDLPLQDGILVDCLELALRGSLFATAAALGAYAATMLFRSTVVTIGLLFAVALAGSVLFGALGVSERWYPHKNVSAIVKDGTQYFVDVPEHCFAEGRSEADDASECDQVRELPLLDGALYYGVLLAGVTGASVLSFRRRDVP